MFEFLFGTEYGYLLALVQKTVARGAVAYPPADELFFAGDGLYCRHARAENDGFCFILVFTRKQCKIPVRLVNAVDNLFGKFYSHTLVMV